MGRCTVRCSQSTGGVSSPLRLVAAQIALKVNKLSSTKTSLPYEYYHLPFCKPEEVWQHAGASTDCLSLRCRALRASCHTVAVLGQAALAPAHHAVRRAWPRRRVH